MKIAVCLKQVPDTVDLQLDPETNTLLREGVQAVLNPLDAFPLEAGLRLRERTGGTVTAFSMGPPMAVQVLRKAVAMGVDDGVLLSDRAFAGADTWATSLALARALAKFGPFDLILCGKQAVDGDTAQVGPGIAAHLGLPQATYVTGIEVLEAKCLRLQRLFESGTAVLQAACPILLTVLKQANEPRLPNLAGRRRSLAFRPKTVTAADLELAPEEVGLAGSPTRVVHVASPERRRGHLRIEGEPAACSRQLREQLAAWGFAE